MIPPFSFTPIAGMFSGVTLRSAVWPLAVAIWAAGLALLVRHGLRKHAPLPPRHPDRYSVLTRDEEAAWDDIEDALLDDIPDRLLEDIGLDILGREDTP